jgi:hypothetical protein
VKEELSGYNQKQSWMRLEGENETFIKSVICDGIWWCLESRVLAVGEVVGACRDSSRDFGLNVTQVRRVY